MGKANPTYSIGNGDHDAMTYMFIEMVNLVGWEAFKQTFRSYYNSNYPYSLCNTSDGTKFNSFLDRLSYFSGQNVRSVFTAQQLAVVEAAYPLTCETGTCQTIPNYDYSITPSSSWQSISSSILTQGCKIYRFSATVGEKYSFKTGDGNGATADFDTKIYLYNNSGTELTNDDDGCSSPNNSSFINEWQCNSSGYYYLKVAGYSSNYGSYSLAFKKTANTSAITQSQSSSISLYPNPAYNELIIRSELPIRKVEVYSMDGTLLLTEESFREKMDISGLTRGVYMVKVLTGEGTLVRRLLKE